MVYGNKEEARVKELAGNEKRTTNNRMELQGAIAGLKEAVRNKVKDITLYTDSDYLVKGATKWIFGWVTNGWKTKSGDDVLNKDLWSDVVSLSQLADISWKLLAGHAGIPANERCDELATSAADGEHPRLYEGVLKGYPVDIKTITISADQVLKKSAGGKAYSYVSKVGSEIKIHKTWAECEARVKGQTGARFRKALSRLDEDQIIKAFSG